MRFSELIPILQIAIGPVILVSGVGLLLLSMTNRFGRAIDRARLLADIIRGAGEDERRRIAAQIEILFRRARLLRIAIALAIISVLLAALLVITMFATALLQSDIGNPVMLLFVACMGSLIASLVVLIQDINLSLAAMRLEIGIDG